MSTIDKLDDKALAKAVGSIIVQLRNNTGLTRIEFSKQHNFNPQYLYDVEMGRKNITIHTLLRICNALNITLATFFNTLDY